MSNSITFGLIGIIAGVIMYIIGTYKLRKYPNADWKAKKWWRIRGQIGGIFFIIIGLLILFGIIDKLLLM